MGSRETSMKLGGLLFPGPAPTLTRWVDCHRCGLRATARQVVLGRGQVPCHVAFVGEGPGRSEDTLGQAFVGPAGRLLDEACGDFARKMVLAYLNLVACRPCDGEDEPNRQPSPLESAACEDRLILSLRLSSAHGVVLLGRLAAERNLSRRILDRALPSNPPLILEISHPAYILRNGGTKSDKYPKYQQRLQSFFRQVHKRMLRSGEAMDAQ